MPRGNVAAVTDKEAGGRKTTKAKAKAAKPEPEKVETAAAPEPEAAPETNGEKQVEELVTTSTTEETIPVEDAPAPTTERAINEKIQKDRQEHTQKMFGGQVEEATQAGPRFIEASIFPDAYCPLCGLKLSGNSKTGFKMAFYTHPFSPSISLGKPCELKGKQLRAPTARMEIVE